MDTRQPLLSITVPCYRQLERARLTVQTILSQSFRDFDLTLADDGASDEYREYAASLNDPRVHYRRNPVRLGAMKNIFAAIAAGRGKYSLAFHEDDLLGRDYLAGAVDILEEKPDCGFVAAELHGFRDDPAAEDLARSVRSPKHELIDSDADLLRAIFRGVEPMFGSIVYRRTAIADVTPALDEYATLADRPFLLAILRKWSAAIVRAPLAWYRAHDAGDGRHGTMRAEHVLRLFRTYRATFPRSLDARDQALFFSYSGHWLVAL